jgi:RNA polymerase sigma-70 factor (ECF subfamily)
MQPHIKGEVADRTGGDRRFDADEALSDEAIIDRMRSGDLASFELIMRRYNQRLFRVARSIVGNDSEAEDIVQETYVRAYEKLAQFEGRARFSTWLTRIAVYEASARRRKLRRMRLFDPREPESPMSAYSPADETSFGELGTVLTRAVDELPASLRAVFIMRVVEGLDTEHTAECLNLTASNVKTRLHRARSLLQRKIDNQIGRDVRRLYQFDGRRCDHIVETVLARLQRRHN